MASSSYFDIDAILAGEPRVYVKFEVAGRGLANLAENAGDDSEDLPFGSRVAVPFWLAESLAERQMVSISIPRCFATGGTTRSTLRADAVSADLRAACAYYFALGVSIAKLLRAPGIAPALLSARAERSWNAVDAGAHAVHSTSAVLGKLDESERAVFFAARNAAVARERWIERRSTRIRAAPAIRRLSSALTRKPTNNNIEVTRREGVKRPAPDTSPVTPRNIQRTRLR